MLSPWISYFLGYWKPISAGGRGWKKWHMIDLFRELSYRRKNVLFIKLLDYKSISLSDFFHSEAADLFFTCSTDTKWWHTHLSSLCPATGWKHGWNRIVLEFHTFSCPVNVLFLEMIDAQHREARRGPVLHFHVEKPFLELSGIVEGKSVEGHNSLKHWAPYKVSTFCLSVHIGRLSSVKHQCCHIW